jgi:hypothetical protein
MVQKVYEYMSIPGDGHPFNLVELVPTDNLGAPERLEPSRFLRQERAAMPYLVLSAHFMRPYKATTVCASVVDIWYDACIR